MVVAPVLLVQQGWPRLCGTGLSCQHFGLPARFPMTRCGRWACRVPQGGFVLAPSPREHSKSQENVGKRSAQVCSVPGEVVNPAPFVPMLLWRVQSAGGLPWTRTSSVCTGVDLTPWCSVSPRWLPCHTASICSALSTILLPAQLSTPMSTSHLLSWCLGQQIHCDRRTAMQLYCAVFWWERWLLVQLGNESLERPPLNPSLSCNSAHPSPGFMNLRTVAQFSSAKQHRNTAIPTATCCSDKWHERAHKIYVL